MKMNGIDFVHNHCRICASNSPDVRNMFEVIYKEKRLFDILQECLQRKLDASEHFPKCICSECCADLIKMHKFIANYEESEKRFMSRCNAIKEITIKTEAVCSTECQEQNPENIFQSEHQIFIESQPGTAPVEEPPINMLEVKEEFDSDYEFVMDELPESDHQTIDGSHFETQNLNEANHYHCGPGNRTEVCDRSKEDSLVKMEMSLTKEATGPYRCGRCLQRFSTTSQLKLHENLYTSKKLFDCMFCDEKFRRKYYIIDHMRKMHPEISFECFVCKMMFERHSNLCLHMQKNRHRILVEHVNDENQTVSAYVEDESNKFKCPEEGCDNAYSEKCKLLDHQLCHSNKKLFECTQQHCSKAFKRKCELKKHLKIHEGKKEHYCDHCGKGFVLESNLRMHRVIHFQEMKYSCKLCPKAFGRMKSLRVHMDRHAGKLYECKYCDSKLASIQGRTRHERNIHGTRKTFECFDCKKVFDEHSDLCRHIKTHSSKRLIFECPAPACTKCFWTERELLNHKRCKHATDLIFDCEYCTQSFKSKANLKSHVRFIHKNELTEYSCAECSATFHLQSLLKSHMYHTHTGESKNLLCPECGKTFRFLHILNSHLRCHQTDRPFACDRCPSQFKDRFELKYHMSMHLSERNYVCDVVVDSGGNGDGEGRVCGKAFVWKASLRSHKLTHSDEKPFACTECAKRFKDKFRLDRHSLTHTGEKPHQCDHCERAFTQKGDLTKHLLIHLGPTPHQCPQCNESFRLKSELRKHSYQHFKPPPTKQ